MIGALEGDVVVGVDGRSEGLDALALGERLAALGESRLVVVVAYPYAPLELAGPGRADDAPSAARALDEARRALGRRTAELLDGPRSSPGARCTRSPRSAPPRSSSSAPPTTARRAASSSAASPPRRCARALRGRGRPPAGRTAPARCPDRGRGRRVRPRPLRGRARQAAGGARRAPRARRDDPCRVRAPADAGPAPSTRTSSLEGEPADALAAHSAELDLLILGSRGRGRLGAVVLGSVAARLIGMARCPVLALPSSASSEPSPRGRGRSSAGG